MQWSKGKVSGAVYWGDEKLTDLLVKVLGYLNKFLINLWLQAAKLNDSRHDLIKFHFV